ncbi:MBL fold metallo-hydrolase [Jongsikchunia kroppenstedtii]|uniref:MBL fold metallo-hydrolase n=1 Tax=Jongsikchunia kroppenstedtii TaxID=1121721 RepID=UPI0003A2DEB2|nr:MBL fold metallo-hydrolase [Jongsikchunia kroppenstedtii]
MADQGKPATSFTAQVNKEALTRYAMTDREDFHDIDRGFLAGFPPVVKNDAGDVVIDGPAMDWITDETPCPDEVNPSLWRQSQLIKRAGLFKVVDGLYQIRLSANITIVDAPDGLVFIDCGLSTVHAKEGLALFRKETGNDKPVAAVIYTHTHFDHYGGVKGLVDEADVKSGKIPIVAPGTIESFDTHAIGENVITGNAMSRRMGYTFGLMLPRCECGLISGGIGANNDGMNPSFSYISPTDPITKTGEKRTLGGWEFEFLYAPDTEAPEEMHIWIPAISALTCAENANHTMHNIQTIRGARTRGRSQFRSLPGRDARALGRSGGGSFRTAHLAGLGQRDGEGVPGESA